MQDFLQWFRFRGWPQPASTPELTLDLSRPALGLIGLGQRADSLKSMLGAPASWRMYRDAGIWLYPEFGVALTVADDQLASIGLSLFSDAYLFGSEAKRPFQPYAGLILTPRGRRESRIEEWNESFAVSALGPAPEREEADDEVLLVYDFERWAIEIEFASDKLAHLEVYSLE